ncbi:MAG: hypothetical protein WCL21_15150 [Mariniphaga sp.]
MNNNHSGIFTRRKFLVSGTLLMSGFLFDWNVGLANSGINSVDKRALVFHHFPNTLHAFIWRNWHLVPIERLAKVVKAVKDDVLAIGKGMGLSVPNPVSADQQQRSYLTIIRCNWHLLPREQLLELLDWTDEKLTFTLQEDDFFYIKLGSLKPFCQPVLYSELKGQPDDSKWIKKILNEEFPDGIPLVKEPLFHFVDELSAPPEPKDTFTNRAVAGFSPRFGYSYFALFGDPLLDPSIDPFPDGFLSRMVASGMDSTWIHIVLSKITPFPWDPFLSNHWEQRLKNLKKLVVRAKKQGIGIFLYLNEPRTLPLSFFEHHPELKGVIVGDQATLCTSHPAVQKYLADSLAIITGAIPNLAGFFSITASENPTNCWSHGKGAGCPRCSKHSPAAVIAGLNTTYQNGIEKGIRNFEQHSGGKLSGKMPQLIVWDWGWRDEWADGIISALPSKVALMSVSEWDLPIERGGVKSKIGEYSISAIGPGPRAQRHWELARRRGLKTIAKIQAGNTWEIAAVPYIPALGNVAHHAANLRKAQVNGLMLGWTLGGYPSPNLEVVAVIGNNPTLSPLQAMEQVAKRRYGIAGAAVVQAWQQYSIAFSEFPFGSGLYTAPLQAGPSNLLWEAPTRYSATMVGIPYDDVTAWTGAYPVNIFISQLIKIADGFDQGLVQLKEKIKGLTLSEKESIALKRECNVAETVAIHCRSAANQANFITLRDRLSSEKERNVRQLTIKGLEALLRNEIVLAKRMYILQISDSRLGFEASNHYFYTPDDLIEKVLNCCDLLERWLPEIS